MPERAVAPRGVRVLHLIPTFESGGAERQLALIAPAQARAGAEVHVAYTRGGPELARLQPFAGDVSLHPLAARGNHDVTLPVRVLRLIRRVRPTVVQTWLPQMDIVGGTAARLARVPWIVAERSSAEAYATRWKDRVLRRAVARFAQGVIANSEGGRLAWRAIAPRVPVEVVPNALPLAEIARATPAAPAALDASGTRDVVIFVGRLTAEKRIDLLFDVVESLARRSEALVLICGDGPLRSALERQVRGSGLVDRIRLLGHRTDVFSLLKRARVFLSTSAFEGNPNAVLEAMACGLEIVASDIPAHREILDERSARLVPLERDAFVAAAMEALSAPADAARGPVAREKVGGRSPDAIARAYLAFCSRIMESHG